MFICFMKTYEVLPYLDAYVVIDVYSTLLAVPRLVLLEALVHPGSDVVGHLTQVPLRLRAPVLLPRGLAMWVLLCVLLESVERPVLTRVFRTVLILFLLKFVLVALSCLLLVFVLLLLLLFVFLVVQYRLRRVWHSCPPVPSVHRAWVGTFVVELTTLANLTTANGVLRYRCGKVGNIEGHASGLLCQQASYIAVHG